MLFSRPVRSTLTPLLTSRFMIEDLSIVILLLSEVVKEIGRVLGENTAPMCVCV